MPICPCGSERDYLICCGAFIERDNIPATPEQLMRSRYTAYTQANVDYIARTMKSPAADNFNAEEAREWAQRVEFIAYFYENKKRHAIHEISEFQHENGRWYYVAGKAPDQKPLVLEDRISRNDPCHCGSQKKYKKCCGKPAY